MEIFIDKVSEVPDIAGKDIADASSLGGDVCTEYIRGIGTFEDRMQILLDIDKVLRPGIERLASGDQCCIDDKCRVDYTANNNGTVENL